MARPRRTKKRYADLYGYPYGLFPAKFPETLGAKVTLFPNGENEIWIQGEGGKGFRLTANEGPAGLSLHISTFVGSPPITISGNADGDYALLDAPDARQLDLCQYNPDERSQAFRRHYKASTLDAFFQEFPKT